MIYSGHCKHLLPGYNSLSESHTRNTVPRGVPIGTFYTQHTCSKGCPCSLKFGLSMGMVRSGGRCSWDTLSRAGHGCRPAGACRPCARRLRSTSWGFCPPPPLLTQPPAFRPPSSFAPEPPDRGGPAARQDGVALSC